MKLITITLALFLVGCASHVRPTWGPDGSPAYFANCRSDAMCARLAGNTCQSRGFEIIQARGNQGFSFSVAGSFANGSSGGVGMTFKCR
jgi:hypothetical protein